MSRIAPVQPPYTEEVSASFSKLMPPGMEPLQLFRVLANNPRVLRRVQRGGLLDPGSVSLRLRELVILRTCSRCSAAYEWGVHAALFGAAAQLQPPDLEAVCEAAVDLSRWTAEESLVLRLCDELHDSCTVSNELFAQLHEAFSAAQILELTVLAGLYHAVSFVVNAAELQPEAWGPAPHIDSL